MATGHPLSKYGKPQEGKLRIFVSQSTISDSGFEMVIFAEKTGDPRVESVELRRIYDEYKHQAVSLLEAIEHSFLEAHDPPNPAEQPDQTAVAQV